MPPRAFYETPKKDALVHLASRDGRCVHNCPACKEIRYRIGGFEAETRRVKQACQILLEENQQLRHELDESQATEARMRSDLDSELEGLSDVCRALRVAQDGEDKALKELDHLRASNDKLSEQIAELQKLTDTSEMKLELAKKDGEIARLRLELLALRQPRGLFDWNVSYRDPK